MITIKLPVQNKINIDEYLREFNSCLRYSYNRFCDGLNEKDIRHLIRNNNLFSNFLDTWFVQCSIREGKSFYEKDPSGKIIFGGKRNFYNRIKNKITNEDWKKLRNYPISIQGESPQKGNRKFKLDIIDNNSIIFKPNRKTKINIQLPKLRKNYRRKLIKLQELTEENKIPFMVKMNNKYLWISFDEYLIEKEDIQLNNKRVFGIDLNPNYIGYSILDFDNNDEFKIIEKGIIENKELNEKLNVNSNHPKQIYQNNKKEFESFEISKFLINKAKHFKCSNFIVEDLNINTKNHKKGKNFNRLVNNCWNRNKLYNNLKKRCNIYNICFVKINPAYSSYIGNILYGNNYPDPISASIEIARRGYKKFEKNWFYPNLPNNEDLSNQWKEAKDWSYGNWKELISHIKTSKLNYRSSLNSFKFKVFRLNNIKSMINLYYIL